MALLKKNPDIDQIKFRFKKKIKKKYDAHIEKASSSATCDFIRQPTKIYIPYR